EPDVARARARDLARNLARNLAHDLARDLDRDLDLVLASDRARDFALARNHARDLDHMFERDQGVVAIEQVDFAIAQDMIRLLLQGRYLHQVRRGPLLLDLMELIQAPTLPRKRSAWCRYGAHLAEYAWIGRAHAYMDKNDSVHHELLDLHWFFQLHIAHM